MKILVVIPAYNVARYLPAVIDGVRRHIQDVVVVDDGSTDDIEHGAASATILLRHSQNLGKGAALKTGFAYAIEKGYQWVMTIDGDGQHDPQYIPDFLAAREATNADLIIGSRRHDKGDMPLPRRLSNWLSSAILSALLHQPIEDVQCGYRLVNADMLKQIELRSDRYQMETEMIIRAVKGGFKIAFVPISVVYGRRFPSAIRGWADTYRWVKLVLELI